MLELIQSVWRTLEQRAVGEEHVTSTHIRFLDEQGAISWRESIIRVKDDADCFGCSSRDTGLEEEVPVFAQCPTGSAPTTHRYTATRSQPPFTREHKEINLDTQSLSTATSLRGLNNKSLTCFKK